MEEEAAEFAALRVRRLTAGAVDTAVRAAAALLPAVVAGPGAVAPRPRVAAVDAAAAVAAAEPTSGTASSLRPAGRHSVPRRAFFCRNGGRRVAHPGLR
jgi:hypothetical protein